MPGTECRADGRLAAAEIGRCYQKDYHRSAVSAAAARTVPKEQSRVGPGRPGNKNRAAAVSQAGLLWFRRLKNST